jgi:hypothetical protein
MKQWKPPKKIGSEKHDPGQIFFSRWGQKLDQDFDAPMMKDVIKQTKKAMGTSGISYFHVGREKPQKKATPDPPIEDFQ